ncbi:steroid alpha reductase-like protein [Hyaloscypha variabilis F]|uniref:very-long-chain enoyl-CoA reductase n=1 Tax=Hyaloscypha variabilis (strain UAMH 11265 / GT02V1 / F) TaxID=1149755 RepID=A0A2J6S511_HYAVF|nr:steroid alpha reductase-like protein [Hyaloscypha variabilis F]
MAPPVTLKVSNRFPKKPIKKLPTSIEITDTTTVQDVKDNLAKRAGGWDPNRFGLYEPEKKKLLKDRKALISKQESVLGGKEILVKDLGLQLSWTTTFIIEYSGPLIFHLLFPFVLRPYLYKLSLPYLPYTSGSLPPLSTSQLLAAAMIELHFAKREYETLFIHRFSLATMPFFNIFKNSFHYWVLSGAWLAYWIYAPGSYTSLETPLTRNLDIIGLILYLFGEVSNFHTHVTLSKLRSKGGTERGIPKGYGFNWVTCPNYLFEMIAWTGVLLVTRSSATVLFMVVAMGQMQIWAQKKERAYRAEFPKEYRKKRYAIIPGI